MIRSNQFTSAVELWK